jgi:DNA-binding CsgD family transcriptional regulator
MNLSNVNVKLLNPDFFLPRESECAVLIAQGHSSKSIAQIMSISPRTVQQHSISIYRKLGISITSMSVRIWAVHLMVAQNIISITYQPLEAN